MIFFKERLVYLAVPKTGTSAIERALGRHASAVFRDPPGMKHTNALGFERKFRGLFERKTLSPLETMAVMREPLDWLGSWYRYRRRPALDGHPNSTRDVSFDEFVEAYLQDTRPAFADIGSQARFLTDQSGALLINHVFAYTDFETIRAFLATRLNRPIEFDKVNTSPRAPLSLSKGLRSRLEKTCAQDFEIYEALKDGPLSVT
ncbi:hypothetical protein C8N43_0701 [Litoreibacter ponti]|uniref:Gamma-glutamyl kinase n=2 Tax=Litoreibacter ponti TaxID=1510457 RepID=A0A2T6BJ16_9RHOB|nr:hypothetical protein C8N43_0701 [Litoreibacter ponti]